MATSLYSTAMKSGVTLDFEDCLKKCQPGNTRYDYYEMLNKWSAVFGVANIQARVFSKSAFAGGDLICDYLSCISPDLINTIDKKISYQNASINAFGQRLLLVINRLSQRSADSSLSKNGSLRRHIVKMVEFCFPGHGCSPSKSDYQKIYDSFYESNKMLSKRYLGKDQELFKFSPP